MGGSSPTLADVDRAARERGESRSRYIARVLGVEVRTRRDAEITRKFDARFADEPLRAAVRREAGDLDEGGADWTTERW